MYCDFFTQTNLESKRKIISAYCEELALRKNFLHNPIIETIYFGGGTPSLLSYGDFADIFNAIRSNFTLSDDLEITLEANPDDLTDEYVDMLLSAGFNRISIGIQSFNNDELRFLNRRHSAEKAIEAVRLCQRKGFDNISIDLMYGLPDQTLDSWKYSLRQAISLNVQHISSYHLIYEKGTKLYNMLDRGMVKETDEDISSDMYLSMAEYLKNADFIHYEVSNFAREGFYSKHNSSYWTGAEYLGIGPAAHSFNGENRSWNVASILKYLDGIKQGVPNLEIEEQDNVTAYNDYILTRMRTMWGSDITEINSRFGEKFKAYCLKNVLKYLESGKVKVSDNRLIISEDSFLVSDGIMSDLMYIGK